MQIISNKMHLQLLILSLVVSLLCNAFHVSLSRNPSTLLSMGKIAEGVFTHSHTHTHMHSLTHSLIRSKVEFTTIAREWRLKFDTKNDKRSLVSAQQTLNLFKSQLQKIPGVQSIQRIVCGGCLDFKVIVALSADKYADWEKTGHAPEAEFINSLKAIDGVTQLETQTYTIEPVV